MGDFDAGVPHAFSASSNYDVLYRGRRYPPKAIVGLAAERVTGRKYGPRDFRGGLNTKCFRLLATAGFDVVAKGAIHPFPDEVLADSLFEGATCRVLVNRYERDPVARSRCVEHHGVTCHVCGMNFCSVYGALGEGFIHVHHLTQLSEHGVRHEVDPVRDPRPVCPNCHAMLHRRTPPYSLDDIRAMLARVPTVDRVIRP